jgi:DNA-binding response OmpR family regulator
MTAHPSPIHVLLVEDDVTLAGLLAHALEGRGHVVETVGSAEDAERRLALAPQPALVVLDVNLPGDSGWSLFRRGTLGVAGAAPTVITSAVPVSPARLREFRVAGYLPKPFSMAALVDCVERLCARPAMSGSLEGVDA